MYIVGDTGERIHFSSGDSPAETQDFVKQIIERLREGYGFVPFIGAGFSAPSGAPLIYEMEEYLQRCICISLGIDSENGENDAIEPWNPRTDQWPPFIDPSRVFDRGYWADLLFHKIAELREKYKKTGEWQALLPLLSEGFGAMQEWRTALLFLSRLNRGRRGTAEAESPRLGVPRQEVIDACFREVLQDKYPALGHRMLAALAGAMRLDTVLTTNFDNLLERAFEAARNPLQVFEVQIEGKLPDWSTLSSVRAVVKLHGGRSSLRADYSLDEPPSEEDRRTFLRYLLSAKGRENYDYLLSAKEQEDRGRAAAEPFDFQNHLLVIGFSGSDHRIRALIEYAWRYLGPNFRVYWICHTDRDVKNIKDFIQANATYLGLDGDEDLCDYTRKTILRHTQAGLFLLQLYQSLRRTLPPLGSIFPAASRLSLPPLEPSWIKEELKERAGRVKHFIDRLCGVLSEFDRQDWNGNKVILASSKPGASGITSVCARAFQELEKEKVCLWLDMNDISSGDNLFEVLLEAIYYRLGLEDWIPSTVGQPAPGGQGDRRGREIDRLIRSVNKRWVVFLNGFETPGVNTSDEWKVDGNGWLDKAPEGEAPGSEFADRSNCAESLIDLLRALCGPSSRMSVVLMCRNRDFFAQGDSSRRLDPSVVELEEQTWPTKTFFVEWKIAVEALRWATDDREKRRFLHALILMQRPRHLATIWSTALSPEGGAPSDPDPRLGWVDELEQCGLVRRKPGGLIWIHSACRQMIRKILAGDADKADKEELLKGLPEDVQQEVQQIVADWRPAIEEPNIHSEIAAWYERVLDASEAPAAAFEAAFHFCRASLAFLKGDTPELGRAEANVDAAGALLKANYFLIQTHGYSRGSCRRLEQVAGIGQDIFDRVRALAEPAGAGPPDAASEARNLVTDAVRHLWVACAEIMRAIAREVGEDAKAYYRHRQAGRLALGATWKEVQTDDTSVSITEALRAALLLRTGGPPAPPDSDWLRWRRWTGMLAIASRSYDKAQAIFEKEMGSFSDQNQYKTHPAYRKRLDTQPQRLELLRMIEQSVELMLLQSSVLLRTQAAEPPAAEVIRLFANAEAMIVRGINLARKVRDSDRSSDSHEVILANWCETRLLMHRSVVECRHRVLGSNTPHVLDAMGILGDAEAKMRVSDARRSRSELAMIDLHRADAKICEAEYAKLPVRSRGTIPLSRLIEEFEGLEGSEFAAAVGEVDTKALARAGALVADGMRFLNRAEPVLRDRRRNVWWTTWFFERKIRAIALSVAVSAFDSGTPIPFLGLEAAMRATETEADRLLGDAVRMIRVDSYRLSSVLTVYVSCIQALHTRLRADACKKGEKELALPRRRAQMLNNLRYAHTALGEVIRSRAEKHPYAAAGVLIGPVDVYIEEVYASVSRFLGLPENGNLLNEYDMRLIVKVLSDRLVKRERDDSSAGRALAAASVRENPKKAREKCGLLREQLALLTGLTLERICKIETAPASSRGDGTKHASRRTRGR